ncbi:MAG: hypothetical protein IPM34_13680 [Saprospiraceae bacterium]|nr:hypothetical protein [Saprospiraceae bacterium]
MKTKLLFIAILTFFNFLALNSQDNPAPPPAPPPAPQVKVQPPIPPVPPIAKEDTTKLNLGNKQIIIIENKEKANAPKEEWEEELEEGLEEMREGLLEARRELEEALKELKKSGKGNEEVELEMKRAEQELQRAEKELQRSEKYKEKDKKKLKLELKLEDQKGENVAPAPEAPKISRKKRKGATVGFLDIDLGLNFMKFGNQVSSEMKSDLKLKNWNSLSTTLTFLPTKIYLGSPHLMLMTGLSWRIGQFEFKEKLVFEPNQTLVYTKQDNVKESQFMTHYLQVPLSLYTESKRIRGLGKIGMGIGGYAGVLLHHEHELSTSDPNQFIETEEDFGMKNFRYGLTGRIDIGAIKFFGNMDLNDLWDNNDIRNIECGIWLDF